MGEAIVWTTPPCSLCNGGKSREECVDCLRAELDATRRLVATLTEALGRGQNALEEAVEFGKDGRPHYHGCIGLHGYACKAWCSAQEDMAAIDAALSQAKAVLP